MIVKGRKCIPTSVDDVCDAALQQDSLLLSLLEVGGAIGITGLRRIAKSRG